MTDHASQGLGALLARPGQLNFQYFEDVLAVEFAAVNARRREHGRADVKPLAPAPVAGAHQALVGAANPKSKQSRIRSPDPRRLFAHSAALREQRLSADRAEPPVDPDKPDYDKTRPQPVPCDGKWPGLFWRRHSLGGDLSWRPPGLSRAQGRPNRWTISPPCLAADTSARV